MTNVLDVFKPTRGLASERPKLSHEMTDLPKPDLTRPVPPGWGVDWPEMKESR
jgi:hypothetical protein